MSVADRIGTRAATEPVADKKTPPVKVWAVIGIAIVAFELYVWADWILGPYFERVDPGPTDPPTWMKVAMIAFQVLGPIGIVALFWFALIKPWRRDGRPSFDGLLCAGLFFVSCQDPLSSYFENWYTYNSWMINFGAWNTSWPGWTSFAEPGQMASEPILFTIPAYIYYLFGLSVFGCFVMRRVKARWPQSGALTQTFACLFALGCCAVVVEGLIWFPLGILTYPGGVGPKIFSETYHTFPLHEGLFIGSISTALALLRYHVNDRGETVVERGISSLKLTSGREAFVRFLAVAGIANVFFFTLYNVPTAIVVSHGDDWPADHQKRSYLTNYICGEGTDRLCPDRDMPMVRSKGIYINDKGETVIPPGYALPKQVPFAP